jgi:phosphohistidine phosphatase
MRLYILRHGIAYEREEWAGPDDSRPLTEDGTERAKDVAKALKKKLKVDAIWSSPLVRCLQTAHITGEVLGLPVKVVDELSSGTTLSRLEAKFKKLEPLPENLMLVGHEPDCGSIIAGLIGDPSGDYALKKNGIALMEGNFKAGGMKLSWKLTPKEIL